MDNLFNKEAEQALLGSMLVDPDAYKRVSDVLSGTEVFFTVDHQKIFTAIIEVYTETEQTDPILVADYLKKTGDLGRVGGADYIYELQAPIVESESAVHYARIVEDYSEKRRFAALLAEHQKTIFENQSTSFQDILAGIRSQLDDYIEKQRQDIKVVTAKELSETEFPPVNWVLEGLIPNGLPILAGDAKVGKSFFAWNVAIATALCGMALGSIEVETKQNVLYLALEDPPQLLQERLKLMTPEGVIPNNLHIINDFGNHRFDIIGLKQLDSIIDKKRINLVIVDTWKHVCPHNFSKNGSAYDVDYENLIPVQNFVHHKNISMILVTHTRKANDIDNPFNKVQGSMGIQAGCDTLMMLRSYTGGKTLNVVGRRIIPEEYVLDLVDGVWQMQGVADEVYKSDARKEIVNLLRDAGEDGLTLSDIVDLTDKKKGTIAKLLRDMIKSSEIVQEKMRGPYFIA